ncbi:hypothetical protein DFA_01932 [Cavenderia fasciculata]|uniref:SUEL-type lectin domain-containing protein n=1 Tax=Cavenderia fasciculata TaxID=261658 RepID=F4PQT5_CACFS|nr:uncharacterized protein DFA_01932 [Cavenderia fasciculata]EGG22043.1 hypothetical protein DFA_01932 [Cavenderia fasciculata]|eukprot:XP_004359894.1 hypothetical protein DFA_01932 [Cavenderia fasciculata]
MIKLLLFVLLSIILLVVSAKKIQAPPPTPTSWVTVEAFNEARCHEKSSIGGLVIGSNVVCYRHQVLSCSADHSTVTVSMFDTDDCSGQPANSTTFPSGKCGATAIWGFTKSYSCSAKLPPQPKRSLIISIYDDCQSSSPQPSQLTQYRWIPTYKCMALEKCDLYCPPLTPTGGPVTSGSATARSGGSGSSSGGSSGSGNSGNSDGSAGSASSASASSASASSASSSRSASTDGSSGSSGSSGSNARSNINQQQPSTRLASSFFTQHYTTQEEKMDQYWDLVDSIIGFDSPDHHASLYDNAQPIEQENSFSVTGSGFSTGSGSIGGGNVVGIFFGLVVCNSTNNMVYTYYNGYQSGSGPMALSTGKFSSGDPYYTSTGGSQMTSMPTPSSSGGSATSGSSYQTPNGCSIYISSKNGAKNDQQCYQNQLISITCVAPFGQENAF